VQFTSQNCDVVTLFTRTPEPSRFSTFVDSLFIFRPDRLVACWRAIWWRWCWPVRASASRTSATTATSPTSSPHAQRVHVAEAYSHTIFVTVIFSYHLHSTSPRDECAFDTLQICVSSPSAQACTNAESVLRICFASLTFGHTYCTWVCTPHPIAGRPTNPEYVFRLGTQIFRLHSACYSSSRAPRDRAL
jgi:hypothetical protein